THRLGLQDSIPVAAPKTRYEDAHEAAVVVRRKGQVLVRRCQPGERWAGLWDFPRFALTARRGTALRQQLAAKVQELTGIVIEPGRRLATLKHGVTRFRITLVCHEAQFISAASRARRGALRWLAPEELAELPLSTTGRKISKLLTAKHHRDA